MFYAGFQIALPGYRYHEVGIIRYDKIKRFYMRQNMMIKE